MTRPDRPEGFSIGQTVSGLGVHHRRRLREIWRSSGWPCQDAIEVELLGAGLLERHVDDHGRTTLRVSDAGVQVLAATQEHNRRARDAHENLVARVALEMHRAGRLVWRGLTLRAPLGESAERADAGPALPGQESQEDATVPKAQRWVVAMPDVFSIRQTSVEAYLEPAVHEIKVRRADLLADLKQVDKRSAYLAQAGECWYVLQEGIGTAADVPLTCGVMIATETTLDLVRTAPRRTARLPFATWMALAKASRCDFGDDEAEQALL